MPPKKKLYIKSYGCQMNVYDSERIVDLLSPLGYTSVSDPSDVDMVILNTCHIREKAEEKVYSDLGRLKQQHKPEAVVAVVGCTAQASGDEIIRRAPQVDVVMGPQTYHRLPEMIAQALRSREKKLSPQKKNKGILDVEFPAEPKFDFLPDPQQATGASRLLTIQEGCDRFCTFCCVPYTRGAEFSRPVAELISEAKRLAELGALDITLLGQNVNAYAGLGLDGKEWSLAQLLEEMAAQIPDVKRLRYMTSHPLSMTDDLIKVHGTLPEAMPFLHLPIQSGSDALLKKMNRQHTVTYYKEVVQKLRQSRPDIALSSDFIVGFPGETEADFQHTLDIINEVRFSQAYSFKYSIRPGTPAGSFEDQVPEEVKEERLARLQAAQLPHQLAFNEGCVGKTLPVLFEKLGKKEGEWMGKTPYMQSLVVTSSADLKNKIIDVLVTEAHHSALRGEIAHE